MSNSFKTFADAVRARFAALSSECDRLYKVSFPEAGEGEPHPLWAHYLASFPPGSNPIFRTNTVHDGSTDRHFIRAVGGVVGIQNGALSTIWDLVALPEPYQTVANHMSEYVRSRPIENIFLTRFTSFGHESNHALIDEKAHTFFHFNASIAKKYQHPEPDARLGEERTTAQVFERGLKELSPAAIDTVLDLIDANAIYRGAEFRAAVAEFRQLQSRYLAAPDTHTRSLTVWANSDSRAARLRNTAIGTLLQSLSEGEDLEKAVRAFERMVAPQNYKRPTALITPAMISKAMETIQSLDLEPALQRRHARFSDVSVNNVLWVDGSVRSTMKGASPLQDLLMSAAATKPVEIDPAKAQRINIADFLSTVAPKAKSLQLLLENRHLSNFVSMTAPVSPDATGLFKWNNNFAWSYDGNLADSDLRAQVHALGGRVDGVLRFSHTWNYDKANPNQSLMDLHVFGPGYKRTGPVDNENEVHNRYPGTARVGWNARHSLALGGEQDVDFTDPPGTAVPVENITFSSLARLPEGVYTFKIHNWEARSPNKSGFKAEIEFDGQIFSYEYRKPLRNKQWITVAEATLKNGKFTIQHHLNSSASVQEKWGLKTLTTHKVKSVILSPNYWDENAVGNKHFFFILDGCRNPEKTRGIYNEFLDSRLDQHRKVFEVLGDKTKCEVADEQMSGVGFSSTRNDEVTVLVDNRPYVITF